MLRFMNFAIKRPKRFWIRKVGVIIVVEIRSPIFVGRVKAEHK